MKKIQKALMTGVSYMLPFIVVAGLTIAITGILSTYFGVKLDVVTKLNGFAWTVMGFIPPIFGAYVAYSIGDKPAIAPGFIGGWIAANPILESTKASGFLGGLLAGLLAGYLIELLKRIPFPDIIDSLKSTIILPLVSSLVVYFAMAYPIGIVIGLLYSLIINGLLAMAANTATAILLGAIISAMIAFDMGGPLGKIAITFIFAVWSNPDGLGFLANAAAFPGCMAPAISVGLAALIAPAKFTESERKSAPTAICTGLVGISEATLPYAFRDPIRVIGCNIIGCSIGGALMMLLKMSTPGVSGLVGVPPANHPLTFMLIIAVSVAISTTLMVIVKKPVLSTDSGTEDDVNIDFTIS
ncbi:MAG TPA: PTS system, fructose subfamily, IIC subunit [Clostridiaceae bacterium]|nr:PTS system, fructose subfamily, IIC subunit [Clostridiaceae bacterium]